MKTCDYLICVVILKFSNNFVLDCLSVDIWLPETLPNRGSRRGYILYWKIFLFLCCYLPFTLLITTMYWIISLCMEFPWHHPVPSQMKMMVGVGVVVGEAVSLIVWKKSVLSYYLRLCDHRVVYSWIPSLKIWLMYFQDKLNDKDSLQGTCLILFVFCFYQGISSPLTDWPFFRHPRGTYFALKTFSLSDERPKIQWPYFLSASLEKNLIVTDPPFISNLFFL